MKDLTNLQLERQNILNNPYILAEIEKATGITGINFENRIALLKEQVASFFEVTPGTIELYLNKHKEELKNNGYEVFTGKAPITIKRKYQ